MKNIGQIGIALAAIWLTACAGMPHGDGRPGEGQGGYAEWRWPYQDPGETWGDQLPHPDKVPTAFRTAQVRLTHMREGCAWLLFPAYVTAAQTQYNKSLRAFAAEFYDDSFVDLRALNNMLDEIDRRLQIAGADGGCSKPRNRYCDGESRGSCLTPGCEGSQSGCNGSGGGCRNCGYVGPEFNCASGASGLRKPGCGCDAPPCNAKPTNCSGPVTQCPRKDNNSAAQAYISAPAPGADYGQNYGSNGPAALNSGVPAGYQSLRNLYLQAQFPYDSDQVLPEYRGYLIEVVAQLREAGFPALHLQGHASSEGSSIHNNDLALRRANRVREIFANAGVPWSVMSASSYGATQPAQSNATEAGRAANRRVEIYVNADLAPAASAPVISTEPVLRPNAQ